MLSTDNYFKIINTIKILYNYNLLLLRIFLLSFLLILLPYGLNESPFNFNVSAQNQPNLNVTSSYYGTVISKLDYDYGPSIMLDSKIYKMWWCGSQPIEKTSGDHIYYATSNDGFYWSQPQAVLNHTGGAEGVHTCDPSVIKINNKYYLYYTSDSLSTPGINNQIFLANSIDGINWDKYPSNNSPQPVIKLEKPDGTYGIGGPSVLYVNNQFILYFVDTTGIDGSGVYIAYSDDGIHFTKSNGGHKLNGGGDVKYISSLGLFFAVYESQSWDYIAWTVSNDGINWLPFDNSRIIQENRETTHNPGILGLPTGTMETDTIVYYGAGSKTVDGSIWNPTTWNICASRITVSLAQSPTPTIAPADANRDGKVDLQDFEIWRKEYKGELTSNTSDFNSDGKVDMIDFESWRKGFFAGE